MAVDYREIGENIKTYRVRRKLKQLQLAELVGVTDQHISHVECGRTKVSLSTLLKISQALSVDIYALLGSNAVSQHDAALDSEFAALIKDMGPVQKELCLHVCRTICEYLQ